MNIDINARYKTAKLIRAVLTGQMCVKDALWNFPKDTQDESLIAAYHALIHYEADEDLRLKDDLYKEEQDDYLEFLSYTLEKGENLPQNIIDNYNEFYDTAPILHRKDFSGFLKGFWKILNISKKKEK